MEKQKQEPSHAETRRRGGRGERQKLKQLWEKQKQKPSHAETRGARRKAKAKTVMEKPKTKTFSRGDAEDAEKGKN